MILVVHKRRRVIDYYYRETYFILYGHTIRRFIALKEKNLSLTINKHLYALLLYYSLVYLVIYASLTKYQSLFCTL